jgi:hypothetical protein
MINPPFTAELRICGLGLSNDSWGLPENNYLHISIVYGHHRQSRSRHSVTHPITTQYHAQNEGRSSVCAHVLGIGLCSATSHARARWMSDKCKFRGENHNGGTVPHLICVYPLLIFMKSMDKSTGSVTLLVKQCFGNRGVLITALFSSPIIQCFN